MATALNLFPSHIRFVDDKGRLTAEAIRAMNSLFTRVGGAVAPSATDLAQSDDDDSALEELRHEAWKALDGANSLPPSLHDPFTDQMHPMRQEHAEVQQLQSEIVGLREEVSALRQELQSLQQGTIV